MSVVEFLVHEGFEEGLASADVDDNVDDGDDGCMLCFHDAVSLPCVSEVFRLFPSAQSE